MMKRRVASLPPVLPLCELYTSSLVWPVARTELTKTRTDTAPITAPVMTRASWAGSSLQRMITVKCPDWEADLPVQTVRYLEHLLQ